MTDIWHNLIDIKDHFIKRFDYLAEETYEEGMEKFNHDGWINRTWSNLDFRRAHLDVVDARDTKGLWMMHVCIFPHTDNTAPIFGYDVIAGRNKITGCFHDFSSVGYLNHHMIDWFSEETKKLQWNKVRELPQWAKNIFSPYMVSAGNINDPKEIAQIKNMIIKNLDYYIDNVGLSRGECLDCSNAHRFYCENQKQNPHTAKVMTNLGLDSVDIEEFIGKCLFPEPI